MEEGSKSATGGCQCGAVRFEACRRLTGAFICHCRMCQRATGSAFSATTLYPRDAVKLTGEIRWYASSDIADRGFCPNCGTSVVIRYHPPAWSGWYAISVTTHDDPESIPAEAHTGVESKLSWLNVDDGLPCMTYPETFLEDIGADDNKIFHLANELGTRDP
ncbi:MAG: GFA family protein [Pseudomonadota bacterium]